MAKWKKLRCSVCGLTLDEHPPQPCRRPITPANVERMVYFDNLKERAEKRRELNTKRRKAKRSHQARQLNISHKLGKKGRSRPTLNRRKSQSSTKHAQKKKHRVYN